MRSLVLTLAAASMVVSGVTFSLHATLAPSSQSSTVADEATTVGTLDSVAVVEPEPPQEAMPAAVLRPSIEASQRNYWRPPLRLPGRTLWRPPLRLLRPTFTRSRRRFQTTTRPP